MPNNHAFATGLSTSSNYSIFLKLVLYFIKPLRIIISFLKSVEVREVFNKCSNIGSEVRIGINAWCYNELSRDRINIGDRSVCRGILRIENWSTGKIDIGKDVYIGDDCLISSSKNVSIGDSTMIAHGVQIFDNNTHPVDAETRSLDYFIIRGYKINTTDFNRAEHIKSEEVIIGKRVWIGFNAIIMRGVKIGDDAIIFPGSIVVNDVPAKSLVAGNPSQIIKKI